MPAPLPSFAHLLLLAFLLGPKLSTAQETPPTSPSQADLAAMEKQCLDAKTLAQFQKAKQLCEKIVSLKQKELSSRERDLGLARLWTQLLGSEHAQGNYVVAEQHGRNALSIRQTHLQTDHPDVAESLNNLAYALVFTGKYRESEHLFRLTLAIDQKIHGPEHPDTAISLGNLAMALSRNGNYTEAEQRNRQALSIWEKLLGPKNQNVANSLYGLANTLHYQGKSLEAELLLRRALVITKNRPEVEHSDTANILNGLGLVLQSQGDFSEAEHFLRDALLMRRKLYSGNHPDIAASLNNIANILSSQNKYAEAEQIHREALAIIRKFLKPDHPEVANSLNNLAVLLGIQGKFAEEEQLLRTTLSTRERQLGSEHPKVAQSLNNLASVLGREGRLPESEELHRRALGMQRKLLGMQHPDVATSLSNLSDVLLAQERVEEAAVLREVVARIDESVLRSSASEHRMQATAKTLRHREDRVYGLVLVSRSNATANRMALIHALLRKGRAQEAGVLFNRLLHNSLRDPAVQKRVEDWRSVREEREALFYRGLGSLKPADYQAQLNDLKIQADSLEAQLAQSLPEIRTLQPPKFDDIIPEVARRIPRDGVLVEVVWTRPFQLKAKDAASHWGAPHFVALLLYPGQRIVSVDLGLAAEIDQTGTALRRELRNPRGNPIPAAQEMYRKVFAPLLPHLAGRTDVYLSLDGSLHMIPFDALHDGKDYLLGQYRFHYLTSGRDLLRQPSQQQPEAPLIVANPDFGAVDSTGPEQNKSLYQKLYGLAPLPAAQDEASYIASLAGTRPLLGDAAQEEVIQKAHAPWFVHIATHGLFLRDVELPVSSDARSSLLPLVPAVLPETADSSAAEKLPGEAGAMNRAALLLAQVRQGHRATSTDKDGLLTAQEARSLDLDGTQLVTLSACDTGEGSLSAGQGVYGLRRAFLVAGAETLVTSLWSVDDQATGELMKRYYAKLLDPSKPGDRLGAMVDSMKELRQMPGRSHPYYWAPFLVIGQDGPLRKPAAVNRQGTTK
jgi:CHAT domain-containing protein/Tfp pilus assembly protein PilF